MTKPPRPRIKIFRYEVAHELPLEVLPEISATRKRLRVFRDKGCVCSSCGTEGTRLVKGIAKDGSEHWVVCTQDLIPLTVDHIIPKSLGGANEINNYQPMCAPCNFAKGNGLQVTEPALVIQSFSNFKVGDVVWRMKPSKARSKFKSKKATLEGTISDIVINPHTGNRSFLVYRKEGRASYLDEGHTYFKEVKINK